MITEIQYSMSGSGCTGAGLVRARRANPNNEESKPPTRHHHLMESLNLNALAGSLPNSNLASAEKELLNNFRGKKISLLPPLPCYHDHSPPAKERSTADLYSPPLTKNKAAALSITNLYRSSRSTSKRAYNSGYAAACADLMQMIQQSVSDSSGSETQPSIGRVMDWVEARLEAIRAREEEEDEEDEEGAASRREKEGQSQSHQAQAGQTGRLKASAALPRANSAPAVPQQAPREQVSLSPFPLPRPFLFLSLPPLPSLFSFLVLCFLGSIVFLN